MVRRVCLPNLPELCVFVERRHKVQTRLLSYWDVAYSLGKGLRGDQRVARA